jgi:hypothetical protein
MPDPLQFVARGKIVRLLLDAVVFNPTGTNYQIHLRTGEHKYAGPVGELIECRIRLSARKIWTVPSGGLFVTPIFGSPRIVQGSVKYADTRVIVVHAGTHFVIEAPTSPSAIDEPIGPITVGGMVNVTALPGARFEMVEAAVNRA